MRIAAIILAVAVALAAAFAVWEAAFALLVGWQTHNWTLWTRFTRGLEWLLPVHSAVNEWANPVVKKLVARATLGAVVVVVVISVAVMQIVQNLRGIYPPAGGSRLATAADLRKADLFNGKPGYSIFLGRSGGKDVRYSGDSHIYVNGPTRSGKGVGFVLPNALEWRGSLIGLDIKREMWNEIGAARAGMGQRVYMYSPGSSESHCWNPLDLVSPWPERATDVANIARSLIPVPETGDSYWAETARGLFAGLLAYVLDSDEMRGQRTIKAALKMMSRGRSLAAVMAEIIASEPNLNEFVLDKFRQHLGREEKQRMSFEAHVVTALDAWNNKLVDDATSRSDFNIADLRRAPFTILIGTPIGNFGSVEAVVRLLVQQVHDVLLKQLPGLDEPHKLLLLLDEFYQFGRMPEIVDRAPLVAGYGFQIAVIAQGLTQLDVRYGKPTRDMLVGNMDVKLLIGVGDETTAKYCADEIGKQYVRREGWGTSVGGGSFIGGAPRASRTTQGRWELEPIMAAESLRRLDAKKAVLLIRSQYAAVLDKTNFFTDGAYKRKAAAAEPFKAQLTVPDVTGSRPAVEWADPAGATELVASGATGARHEAALSRVMAEAEGVFADVAPFRLAFVNAMNEPSNELVAELCKRLRVDPESVAPIKRARGKIFGSASADEATKALRGEIIAARHLLNADRAERATIAPSTPASSPAPMMISPATSVEPAPASASAETASGGSGDGGQVELRADMPAMMADVDDGAAGLSAVIDAALEAAPDAVGRAAMIEGLAAFQNHASLFQDTPDDLHAHVPA
ncbi:MAG: type IV secretory system conjugative DNA transfer family protein [Hyphomicrobiales bacterium]|nr:type IV secretory system conjugative DNA transfer family protein [Hyphomicrobiales bacterium]